MADMMIIDFDTLTEPILRSEIKNLIIEYLVERPGTLITVLNASQGAQPLFSATQLDFWMFPRDAVANNPLTLQIPTITFKTMFATSFQERQEHKVVLVIDKDLASQEMWGSVDSTIEIFKPASPNQSVPRKKRKHEQP